MNQTLTFDRYAIADDPAVRAADARLDRLSDESPDYDAAEAEAEALHAARRLEVAQLLREDTLAAASDAVSAGRQFVKAQRRLDDLADVAREHFTKTYPSGWTTLHADVRPVLDDIVGLCFALRELRTQFVAFEQDVRRLSGQETGR
jgi:hypothetical protein